MDKDKFINIVKTFGKLIEGSEFSGKVYAVGGSVRDYVLGNEINDIDLAVETEDGGIKLSKFIEDKLGNSKSVTFPNYGTAKFEVNGIRELEGIEFEAVQTRKEWYTNGSRKPSSIALGTIEDDAMRRDLTINALYMNVNDLKIYDPTGKGKEDIKNKIIRVPFSDPSKTFSDDPLRMLRVIRFASKLGWKIDSDVIVSIFNMFSEIKNISRERITDEFDKILLSKYCHDGLVTLYHTGLLGKIIPEIRDMRIVYLPKNNCTLLDYAFNVLKNVDNVLEVKLSALFYLCGVEDEESMYKSKTKQRTIEIARNTMKRLGYSNSITSSVIDIISHYNDLQYDLGFMNIANKDIRKIVYNFGDKFKWITNLIDIDNKTNKNFVFKYNQIYFLKNKINGLINNGENLNNGFKLPLNGNDIMEELSIPPSNKVKLLLDFARELYFENPKITKEECFIKIKEHEQR